MTQLLIDSDVPKNFATFAIPSNHEARNITFLKGQIVLSTTKDVMIGDGVLVVTGAVSYILQNADNGNAIFEVEIIENDRKQNESDPQWFAHKVALPKQIQDNSASIKAHLDIVLAQTKTVMGLL